MLYPFYPYNLTTATLTLHAGKVLPLRLPSQHGHAQVCKHFSHDILSPRGLHLKHPLHNRNREENLSVWEILLVGKENESQWNIYIYIYIKNLNVTKSKLCALRFLCGSFVHVLCVCGGARTIRLNLFNCLHKIVNNMKYCHYNQDIKLWLMEKETYTTADRRLSTVQNARRNIPGPRRPMLVISRRTDRTVHFRSPTRVSAKWPATAEKYYP